MGFKIALVIACLLGLGQSAWAESVPEIVLQTIAMESASKPEGMPYVALVLANRARVSVTSMEIEAKRPFQFSCWNDEKWARAWLASYYDPKTRHDALIAYNNGLAMSLKPELQGIRHYCTTGTNPAWAKGKTPKFILGGHKWYEGIK